MIGAHDSWQCSLRLIDCDRLMMKLMLVGTRHFRNLFLNVFCGGRVVSMDLIVESKGLFLESRMCMFLNPPNAIGEICHIVILDVKTKGDQVTEDLSRCSWI